MSENLSGRQADDAAQGAPKAPSSPPLHLEAGDDSEIFSDDLEPTDESPTIISKNPPAQPTTTTSTAVKAATPEALLGSLRGRRLAHFELIEPIGVGGMAAVLRARDTLLDRYVALKILPPDMANDHDNIRRFRQEAQQAAKLDHENIARVFFCGEDQKLNFIAFEFVQGENLRSILERRGRLPVAEAVRYVLQVATGLEHASARDVVHRDVKPSNIIITPTGRAKLVDMGLARSMQPQREQLTQSGVTLGTFDYISPEQALEPREADARSDIYSLGCTFYHMLTGYPPVPEGTAAKKVHHHQHVAPIDPRQYDPSIPNEVAMILAKMMAKNPKDRYQRPLQLVQHLMQVAHKVGAAADMPEGVLFVDTPLLSPPRKRPLLLVSLGALALALVLMVLTLAPPVNRHNSVVRPPVKDGGAKDNGSNSQKPAVVAGPPTAVKSISEISSEEDLKALLADSTNTNVKAIVTAGFTISEPGLLFQALADGKRTLILEGKVEKVDEEEEKPELPVITWKYDPKRDHTSLVQLEGAVDATFNNLAFRVEAPKSVKSPETVMVDFKVPKQPLAIVAVRSSGSIRFVRCSFEQIDMPLPGYINVRHQGTPLASVLVQSLPGKSDRPQVQFEQCVFKSGQVAVGVQSAANIVATQSAFRPHGAMFHLHGDGESKISLKNCSAFVVSGPVFRVDDNASCRLKIDYSVFSCPESTVSDRDPIHLIHQTDGKEPRVTFQKWTRNCYHNLNGLWSWPTENGSHIIASLDEFRAEIAKAGGGSDSQSTALPESVEIWRYAQPHTKKHVRAFKLLENVPEVRTTDARKSQIGVEKNDLLEVALAAFKEEPSRVAGLNLAENERVVDPTTDNTNSRVHESVAQALYASRPGDVILLKHGKNKRELLVEMMTLKKAGLDVTLRPFDESYQPILSLADTLEPVAHFFRLQDGKMTFENLEIVLVPDQKKFKAQTLAQMDGNARCAFRNCVITLKQDYDKNPDTVPLNIVSLSEIDEAAAMMDMKSSRAAAEVVFDHCFIRGEGVAVANPGGRALDLRLDNTLAGLSGSLLATKGAAKDPPPETFVKINLTKSSVFTTKPMLVFEARNSRGLPPVRVEQATACLFVALEDKPFITTGYPEMATMLRSHFDWKSAAPGNAYSGFDRMLDDTSSDFRLDQTGWSDAFYKGLTPLFTRAAFKLMPARPLWFAVPDDFKPKDQVEMLQPFGAVLDESTLAPVERKS